MRAAIVTRVAALALALAVFVGVEQAVSDAGSSAARECFPAKSWGPAPDGLRPCVRITRLFEDGSFRFTVTDANGTVRYTSGVGALDR